MSATAITFSGGLKPRFFRILEGTKNEYVTIGSDGRICRWGKKGESDAKDQQWCVYPVSEGCVMIQTLQNEEFMTVMGGGEVRRWGRSANQKEQTFRLTNFDDDGWFNIEENTRGECVGVGDPVFGVCFLVRWQKSGGKDQRFKLEAVEDFTPEPLATLAPEGPPESAAENGKLRQVSGTDRPQADFSAGCQFTVHQRLHLHEQNHPGAKPPVLLPVAISNVGLQ